jgi:hypothetical protein
MTRFSLTLMFSVAAFATPLAAHAGAADKPAVDSGDAAKGKEIAGLH